MTSLRKDRVLIVTSDSRVHDDIVRALGSGYDCRRAGDDHGAMKSMAFKVPSLIIAGGDAGDTTGIDLLQTIRKSIKTKLIPFIIVTTAGHSETRTRAFEAGADASIAHPFAGEELRALVRSSLTKFRDFYLLAITDELTRLSNRREFINKFNDEVGVKKNRTISLAILDLDHFKQVNDLYGHQMGDQVLMRLAELLQGRTSEDFFPARFGGEEFVILFRDLALAGAHEVMETILGEFSSILFKNKNKTFRVTFSTGLAEYPSMALTASELLSRADQALYAAKKDGRNRVYAFSPIMAHNDQFWEYMRTKQGVFTDAHANDSITGLPYLPQLLDAVSDLDFEIRSIGVLILSLKAFYDTGEFTGIKNLHYDLENIRILIVKSCELIFPSDTYVGLSDLYTHEFIVLFPSAIDFSFNRVKFAAVCRDICAAIDRGLERYSFSMSWGSGIVTLDASETRRIVTEISAIRAAVEPFKGRPMAPALVKAPDALGVLPENCCLGAMFESETLARAFSFLCSREPSVSSVMFEHMLMENLARADLLRTFLCAAQEHFGTAIGGPLIFPCIRGIKFQDCVKTLHECLPHIPLMLMINEYQLKHLALNEHDHFFNELPDTISLGIDNCYIGKEILNLLSRFNLSLVLLSENIVRNIYHFKDRIKIISGLKIFLDQIGVPAGAKGICREEEYHIIKDLGITYVSGPYFGREHDITGA